jgi:hypothetical protein
MTSQSRKAGLEKLEIVLSASVFWRGGRKGGSVFALPPAEPINKIGSDFFKYTPPIRKRGCLPKAGANPRFSIFEAKEEI